MAFGFGRNKTSQQSTSSSSGYSFDQSSSLSESMGSSVARGGSEGRSFTDVAFQDIFANLYGGAAGAASRLSDIVPSFAEEARSLFSGGIGFLDQLRGGGAGAEYLEGRVGGDSSWLDEQIGGLGEDLGRFFREELNPAITSRAVAGGTLGGGRQGVAQGRAADAVTREFQRGATSLRSADVAQRDAAAGALMAGQAQGAGVGLGALPGLMGVAEGGFGAEMLPYQLLAGIMGGPTTLAGSESSSFDEAQAFDVARAIAESMGRASQQSTSQSTGKGGGFQIGW
jgi:hypothetical protein